MKVGLWRTEVTFQLLDQPGETHYRHALMSEKGPSPARLQFRPVNGVLLGGALVALAGGYLLLAGGSTTLAPALLVLGYCVLFPLGLAL